MDWGEKEYEVSEGGGGGCATPRFRRGWEREEEQGAIRRKVFKRGTVLLDDAPTTKYSSTKLLLDM